MQLNQLWLYRVEKWLWYKKSNTKTSNNKTRKKYVENELSHQIVRFSFLKRILSLSDVLSFDVFPFKILDFGVLTPNSLENTLGLALERFTEQHKPLIISFAIIIMLSSAVILKSDVEVIQNFDGFWYIHAEK